MIDSRCWTQLHSTTTTATIKPQEHYDYPGKTITMHTATHSHMRRTAACHRSQVSAPFLTTFFPCVPLLLHHLSFPATFPSSTRCSWFVLPSSNSQENGKGSNRVLALGHDAISSREHHRRASTSLGRCLRRASRMLMCINGLGLLSWPHVAIVLPCLLTSITRNGTITNALPRPAPYVDASPLTVRHRS